MSTDLTGTVALITGATSGIGKASMAEDDIDAVFAINVKMPFVLVGELAPAMASRGKGAIVNVGTMAAEFQS